MRYQSETKFLSQCSLTLLLDATTSEVCLTILITQFDKAPLSYAELAVQAYDTMGTPVRVQKAPHEPAWLGQAGSCAGYGANARYVLKLSRKQKLARVEVCRRGRTFSFSVLRAGSIHNRLADKSTSSGQVRATSGNVGRVNRPIESNLPKGALPRAGACVFIPTFRDTDRLEQNFAGTLGDVPYPIFIYDDNLEEKESRRVKALCRTAGWKYRRLHRGGHQGFAEERLNHSGFNQFIWTIFTTLGRKHAYVVKLETDSYILAPDWINEFDYALNGHCAIAGTPEYRAIHEVRSFWNLARDAELPFGLSSRIMHMQGGIYGLSRNACEKLAQMGFLGGRHVNFRDDCYISYCCQLLGVRFVQITTVCSWAKGRRPALETLHDLKAIHPLCHSEWTAHKRIVQDADPARANPSRSSFYARHFQIPPIAHFVWVGSALPQLAQDNIAAFKQHHPEWSVRVWHGIPECLPLDLRDAVLDAPKLAMRSDVIRLWLIYRYGGLYLDTDVCPVRNMDELRYYQHFVSWEWNGRVNNAIIGSQANHEVVRKLLDRVKLIHRKGPPNYILTYGPDLLTNFYYESYSLNPLPLHYFYIDLNQGHPSPWWKLPETEKQLILAEAQMSASDGVMPFAVHLYGIPEEKMPDGLPQSSVADAVKVGDLILHNVPRSNSAAAFVGLTSLGLAAYLLSFQPALQLALVGDEMAETGDPTAFAAARRVWIKTDDINRVSMALDWLFLDASVKLGEDRGVIDSLLSGVKNNGIIFGLRQDVRDYVARCTVFSVVCEDDSGSGVWTARRDSRVRRTPKASGA